MIRKTNWSVFYGTPLPSPLVDQRLDTVIVTGCLTSRCARATVVDVFLDRGEPSHAVSLFDMDQTYTGVIDTDGALASLGSLPDDGAAGGG